MGGGLIFYDDRRADPTDPISPKVGYGNQITIGNVFNNMDGLGRRNRFRYDSPKFFGFWAQGGLTSGNGGDASLWYADKLGPVKLAGAISYANPSTNNPVIDQIINGSISALWNGFNLTLAAGVTEWDDRQLRAEGKNPRDYDDQELFYAKLGYRHEWFNLGETRLSIDYARNKNVLDNIAFRNKDSDADSVGLMFVQMIDKWATESYLGIRWHSLDDLTSTTDPLAKTDFNDVWAVMAGMRVKF
jgi:hypothetical protein